MDECNVEWWAGGELVPGEMTWEDRRDEVANVLARAVGGLRGRWLGDGGVDGELGMPGVPGDAALRLDLHANWPAGQLEASEGARPDGGVG